MAALRARKAAASRGSTHVFFVIPSRLRASSSLIRRFAISFVILSLEFRVVAMSVFFFFFFFVFFFFCFLFFHLPINRRPQYRLTRAKKAIELAAEREVLGPNYIGPSISIGLIRKARAWFAGLLI